MDVLATTENDVSMVVVRRRVTPVGLRRRHVLAVDGREGRESRGAAGRVEGQVGVVDADLIPRSRDRAEVPGCHVDAGQRLRAGTGSLLDVEVVGRTGRVLDLPDRRVENTVILLPEARARRAPGTLDDGDLDLVGDLDLLRRRAFLVDGAEAQGGVVRDHVAGPSRADAAGETSVIDRADTREQNH